MPVLSNFPSADNSLDEWKSGIEAEVATVHDLHTDIKLSMADLIQLKPEFANSIEECTDTSKVYVLPDGYIYAYMKKLTSSTMYTNVYNEDEALVGYRLGSAGTISAYETGIVSNFIQVLPDTEYTIRLLNCGEFTGGNDRISEYSDASDSSHVQQTRGITISKESETNGALKFTFTTQSTTNYLRFSFCSSDEGVVFDPATIIITLNQPIEVQITETLQWANTSHAFVPADYEDRILSLETAVDSIGSGANGAPDYIIEEAKRVASLVASKKTIDSFSFIAATDTHYATGADTPIAVMHTGMGAEYIRRYTQIDMLAMLGDYIGGADGDTKVGATDEYLAIHKAMYSAGNGIKQLWLRGNHDRLLQSSGTTATAEEFTLDEMYAHIGSMNADTISADGSGSYGYLDFEQKKVRVVYLNTSDDDVIYVWCSPSQVQWIADNALNLSDKETPAEWNIIVLSHIPLWGDVFDYITAIQTMIDAYNDGESGSVVIGSTTITYDFAVHGEIICLVNGHTHNFATATTPKGIPCFSVPQACAARYNEYATGSDSFLAWGEFNDSGEPVYYQKVVNTSESTSFNVFTIDRKNRKIYAHCYGAGIDREVDY